MKYLKIEEQLSLLNSLFLFDTKMPNLKIFILTNENEDNEFQWKKLFESSPNLEKITFGGKKHSNLINSLINLKKLNSLSLICESNENLDPNLSYHNFLSLYFLTSLSLTDFDFTK